MFKRLPKMAILVLVIASLMLSACEPAPTPTPTPEPVVVTEAPVEEAKPSIDPTGQTVSFWHVWGTGLPNETMLAIVDEFNASNEWGITVEAVDQGGYSDLEDALTPPFNLVTCLTWPLVTPMLWPTGIRLVQLPIWLPS